MKINDDKTVTFDEDECMVIASMAEGIIDEINRVGLKGYKLNRDEKEFFEKVFKIHDELEHDFFSRL